MRYVVARIAGSHLGTDPDMMGLVKDMLAPGTTLIDGYVFDIDDDPEFQLMVYEAGIVTVLIGPLEEE